MAEQMYKGMLYLDVDGVLFPHWAGPGDITPHPDGLEWEWLNHDEYYQPQIAEQLGGMALKAIAASSRQISDFLIGYNDVRHRLGIDSCLMIGVENTKDIDLKARAVLDHWTGSKNSWSYGAQDADRSPVGDRAVWIDDNIHGLSEDMRAELAAHPEIMTIVPQAKVGLTAAHLQRIEDFLAQPIAKTDEIRYN